MTSLPEGWALVRLGDHFTITSSKRVFQRDWRTVGVPFYRARELAVLGEKGRVDNELFIDREMFDRYRRAFGAPSSGDFLVTGVGTLGKTYVVHPGDEFYFKDGNIIWFKASATVDSFYLNQLYRTPFVLDQVFANSGGSTVGTYTITNAKLTVIPLPPLEEQSAIAAALADADDLIATLERLIAKKQAIKQGMMQQLLTGRTRLPGFSDSWQPSRLGELSAYEQPGRYLVSSADYTDTGTPVLTAGKTFVLGHTSESHGIFTNVPVIIFDDFTTASKYVDFPFKAKSSAMKMLSARPGVNLRYIFERMQLIDFVTVDHKRRWIAEFSRIEILTPGAEEQVAIAGVLEDAETEIAVLARRLQKARAIKVGMMQQLLTGRTRLPVEAAP